MYGFRKLYLDYSNQIWKQKKRYRNHYTDSGLFEQLSHPFKNWGREDNNYCKYKKFYHCYLFSERRGCPLIDCRGECFPKNRPILCYLRHRRELKPKHYRVRYSSKPYLLLFLQCSILHFRPEQRPSHNKNQMRYDRSYPYYPSRFKHPELLPRVQECLRYFEREPLKPDQDDRKYKWDRTECWTQPDYSRPPLIKLFDKLLSDRMFRTHTYTWDKSKYYRLKPDLFEELKRHGNNVYYIGQRDQEYQYPYSVSKDLKWSLRMERRRRHSQPEGNHLHYLFWKVDSEPGHCSDHVPDGYILCPDRTEDGWHYHQRNCSEKQFHKQFLHLHFFQSVFIISFSHA